MLDLKNKMTESIEKKLLFLSLGGTVLCFLCISCLFMFTLITTEESLFQGFHLLREGITEEITEHSSRNKAQLYENHVVSVAENMNLNISECMDDVELIAVAMSKYMQYPENYKKNYETTSSNNKVNMVAVFSSGVNSKSDAIREELAFANNIGDLLFSISRQYVNLPVVFYVISKNGFCLSIDSDVLNINSKTFSFLPLTRKKRNFDARGLPAYSIQTNPDGKGRVSSVYFNNDEPVISCSFPYYDKNGMAGVVACDVSIRELLTFSRHTEGNHEGKLFFMDNNARIIVSDFEKGFFSVDSALRTKPVHSEDIKSLLNRIAKGETSIFSVDYEENSFHVAYAPVKELSGHLAVVYFEDEIKRAVAEPNDIIFKVIGDKNNTIFSLIKDFRFFISAILIVLLLISLEISYKLVKKYNRPLNQLSSEIQNLSTLDLDKRLSINSEDEIETLADNINNMVHEIKKKVEFISRVSSENEKIEETMKVAKTIQSNMLPKKFDVSVNYRNYELFAMNMPAKYVSGDFYDFFMIDDDRLIVTIADVSGKGIPAALFMVASMTILRNLSYMMLRNSNDLAKVVTQTNIQLCDNNKEEMFVTLFTAIINLKTREMTYVCAGHNPPLLLSRKTGSFDFLKTQRIFPILGVSDLIEYGQNNLSLDDGDCLLLYTDGVTEAIDKDENLFGEDRLIKIMNEEMKYSYPERIIRGIYSSVMSFSGETEQFDDITMLCFRFK